MGNDQSTTETESEQNGPQILDNYNIIKKFADSKLGDITLLEEKNTKEECILREINSTDEDEYAKGIKKYNSRYKLTHPNIIQLKGFTYKAQSQFCSTFYKIYLLYEHVANHLEKEVQARQQQQTKFTQDEMWSILGGTISGLAFLERNNIQHQNIKLNTIFISKTGMIKISDQQLQQQMNIFASVITTPSNPPKSAYLSPVLVKAIEENNWHPQHNVYKSDIFSLGMSIIHASLLESLDSCYQYDKSQFLSEKLNEYLSKLNTQYSKDFSYFLNLMVKLDENERPDFIQLEELLQAHQLKHSAQASPEKVQQLSANSAKNQQSAKSSQEQQEKNQIQQEKQENPLQMSSQSKINKQPIASQDVYQEQNLNVEMKQLSLKQSPTSIKDNQVQFNVLQKGSILENMLTELQDYGTIKNYIPNDMPTKPIKPDDNLGGEQIGSEMKNQQYSENQQQQQYILNNQLSNQKNLSAQPQQFQETQQQTLSQQKQTKEFSPQVLKNSEQISNFILNNNNNQIVQQVPTIKQITQEIKYTQEFKSQLPEIKQDLPYTKANYGFSQTTVPQTNFQQFQYQNQEKNEYKPMYQENLQSNIPYSYYNISNTNKQTTSNYDLPLTNQATTLGKTYQDFKYTGNIPNQYSQTSVQVPATNKDENKYNFEGYANKYNEYKPINEPKVENQLDTYKISASYQPMSYSNANLTQNVENKQLAQNNITSAKYDPDSFLKSYQLEQYKPKVEYDKYLSKHTEPFTYAQLQTQNQPISSVNVENITYSLPQQHDQVMLSSQTHQLMPQQANLQQQQVQQQQVQQQQVQQQQSQLQQWQQQQQIQLQQQQQQQKQLSSQTIQTNVTTKVNSIGQTNEQGLTSEVIIESYQNGSKYEGQKLNGMRHGKGKFYYQDGGLYDGEWKFNKMHGKGILYYASGKIAYDGDWVEDKFDGYGLLYNENPVAFTSQFDFRDLDFVEEYWEKYQGEFKDDNKEGYGTLHLSNGEKFAGVFKRDFVNGTGTFYKLDGTTIQGTWVNNKFIN